LGGGDHKFVITVIYNSLMQCVLGAFVLITSQYFDYWKEN